ncbi:MAG: hypothetical protein ACYCXR_03475 [Coriobacteriia bacterium]
MKRIAVVTAAVALLLLTASPALALPGAGGAGLAFGTHHAEHAQEMSGFDGEMNPGMHQGFSGWMHEG